MKSEHVLNSARQKARLRHKRAGLDLCMSELNLTLTAKPSTVSTGVNWTQNATILHRHHHRRHRCRCRGRCAKCTAFADAMVFVVCKTGSRRWMTAPWNTSVSGRTSRERCRRLTLRDPSRLPAAFRVCSQSAIFAAI